MAGSPKKRAREKARRLEETAKDPATLRSPAAGGNPVATLPAPLTGEILPPEKDAEPTRTALKRAMRQSAQKYAEAALTVLAEALKSPDQRIRVGAANDILDRAYGKPTPELDADSGGLLVTIMKFGEGV
jgi:hypothetical protein